MQLIESDTPGTQPIGITDIYNSSPSKFQPWMQVTGGIPPKARMCRGSAGYNCPEADSTHGIAKGSLLIMENAPKGIRLEGYDCPEADSTHGIAKGSLLIMENAPKGIRLED